MIVRSTVTFIKRSPFSCLVIENIIWIEPLLRGHLSYKATFFLCPKGDLLMQVWLYAKTWECSECNYFEKKSLNNDSQHISQQNKLLNLTLNHWKKEATTYCYEGQGPWLGQAQKYGCVKLITRIATLLLLIIECNGNTNIRKQ